MLPIAFDTLMILRLSKQFRPRSDSSWRSSKIRDYSVWHSFYNTGITENKQQDQGLYCVAFLLQQRYHRKRAARSGTILCGILSTTTVSQETSSKIRDYTVWHSFYNNGITGNEQQDRGQYCVAFLLQQRYHRKRAARSGTILCGIPSTTTVSQETSSKIRDYTVWHSFYNNGITGNEQQDQGLYCVAFLLQKWYHRKRAARSGTILCGIPSTTTVSQETSSKIGDNTVWHSFYNNGITGN